MMDLKTTSKFRKDYKRCKKRGLNMDLLKDVINTLLEGATLDEKYQSRFHCDEQHLSKWDALLRQSEKMIMEARIANVLK